MSTTSCCLSELRASKIIVIESPIQYSGLVQVSPRDGTRNFYLPKMFFGNP